MRDEGRRDDSAHMGRETSAPHSGFRNGDERSGFTAVNGNKHEHAAFRPEHSSAHALSADQADRKGGAPQAWRASGRNDSVMNAETASKPSPEGAKRKRSDDELREGARREVSMGRGRESPKRRLTELNLDTRARKLEKTTPESSDGGYADARQSRVGDRPSVVEQIPISINPSGRERSPVLAWNQRELLPQVRPETEADLAQSLASHLHSVTQSSPTADSPSTTTHAYAEHRSQEYSPDASGTQAGKKKRNFSNRTKTGCHTCRERKKKCDEAKPICNNCARGNFSCGGYGPKPPGFRSSGARNGAPIPLQSKSLHDPNPAPISRHLDGPRYDHWGRVAPLPPPPHHEPYPRYPSDPSHASEDSRPRPWPRPSWDNSTSTHYSPHPPLPPVDLHPPAPYDPPPPPPPPSSDTPWPHALPPPPTSHRAPTISSHSSTYTSTSARPPAPSPLHPHALTEKEKMLLGRPYLHYIDDVLLDDRQQCKAAVERYNNAARPSEAISSDERSRFFSAVIDPARRPVPNAAYRDVPPTAPSLTRPGRIGYRTIVEAPFNCDYGYNISLGDDVVIGAGCYIQDPCEVYIGSRTIVGPNVRFYGGSVAGVEVRGRGGSQGVLVGGGIDVGEDVFLGGDVIVLSHRVIGRGAVVGAGSVVTRNVPPYTVVAGNPAREIRTLDPSAPGNAASGVAGGGGGVVEDRRMRAAIQAENESSLREMRGRRGWRE